MSALEKKPEDRLLSHLARARTLALTSRVKLRLKGEIRVSAGNLYQRGLPGTLYLIRAGG